jgi:hypothetical protein
MRKHELYPNYRDLFEYYGSKEIERVRIKGGQTIRRDWFVFESEDDAMLFFSERCGAYQGWYA